MNIPRKEYKAFLTYRREVWMAQWATEQTREAPNLVIVEDALKMANALAREIQLLDRENQA